MSVSPRRNATSKALERKLAAFYTVASGTLLAATASGQAHADIVFTPENVTLTPGTAVTPTNVFYLSMPNDGTPDFAIVNAGSGPGESLGIVVGAPTASVVLDPTSTWADALSSGTLISSGSNFGAPGSKALMGGAKVANTGGPWLGVQDQFLGVSFQRGTSTYYGWIEASYDPVNTGNLTILGYAYNNVAGESILAGQTSATAVPEPATTPLVLLALDAVGVRAMRRARKQAQPTPAA
jgi:hypothetical protein